jgi:hypothetical protein
MTRKEAYCWLARALGVPEEQAHMARMKSVDRLKQVVAICDQFLGRTEVDDDFSAPPPSIISTSQD